MKAQAQGFTLVELIVVIVILGILAATALPRFINVTTDARIAAVNGIAGGLRSAMAVAQAKWQASGGTGSQISMVGTATSVDVDAATGVPHNSLTGIIIAMGCTTASCSGVTVTNLGNPGTSTWTPSGSPAGCDVSYASTGTVTPNTGAC